MHYQTQQPFFCRFPSFSSIPCLPSTISCVYPSLQEMECTEAALKPSFRREMACKPTPQAFFDDFCVVNGQNTVAGEDFLVEEFLDLSNDDGFLEQEHDEEEEEKVPTFSPSVYPSKKDSEDYSSNESTSFEFESLPASELSVPADDVLELELEWLSHFVEDSNSEYSAAFPAGTIPTKPKTNTDFGAQPENPVTSFKTPVPAKTRSKRKRTGGRLWSLVGSPSATEPSSSSSSSSSSCSSPSPCLIYSIPGSGSTLELAEPVFYEKPPPVKKQKKKLATDSAGGTATQPPRRCSHCGVTKTPQWRAGPLGTKTLCNACGVRYKSGRLLPEYRPACSPTFSSELHSNHHRKVLEMRQKKILGQPEPSLPPPVLHSY